MSDGAVVACARGLVSRVGARPDFLLSLLSGGVGLDTSGGGGGGRTENEEELSVYQLVCVRPMRLDNSRRISEVSNLTAPLAAVARRRIPPNLSLKGGVIF